MRRENEKKENERKENGETRKWGERKWKTFLSLAWLERKVRRKEM